MKKTYNAHCKVNLFYLFSIIVLSNRRTDNEEKYGGNLQITEILFFF
jgi:hypothetical protein